MRAGPRLNNFFRGGQVLSPTPPPTNTEKFWFDGLPFEGLGNSTAPTAGLKQWFDGLPVPFIG